MILRAGCSGSQLVHLQKAVVIAVFNLLSRPLLASKPRHCHSGGRALLISCHAITPNERELVRRQAD